MYDFLTNLFGSPIIAYIIAACLPLFLFVLPYAVVAILLERKIAGHMQDRLGPMRTGYHGLIQTVADVLKLLTKEDIIPTAVNRKLFILAPILVFAGSYGTFAVLPFCSQFIGSDIDLGVFFLLAISSIGVVGIIMGGWSSNNKYSLYGALRSAAQVVSYEIPTAMIVLSLIIMTGTLNLKTISELQSAYFWNWNIFGGASFGIAKFLYIPFMIAAFLIIYISTLAEVNRTPFDIPEAESELVGGYHTEYSGMRFAFFFLAEYANMYTVSALVTCLFFGGYQSPFGYLGNLTGLGWLIPFEQIFWFTFKGIFFVCVQMWLRWTLPRLRVDQLMALCWKYLIPYAFVVLVFVGLIALI